jgi:hypothetical protein
MKNRLLTIGFACCLLTICLYFFAGINELLKLQLFSQHYYMRLLFNELIYCSNVLILIFLWRVLVQLYKQYKLNLVLKLIIFITVTTGLLSFLMLTHEKMLVTIIMSILAVSNMILYYIFIFRIMNIEKTEIAQIEYLKNYSIAFAGCIFFLLILNIIEFKTNKELSFISYFLNILPVIFIAMFFQKTKEINE